MNENEIKVEDKELSENDNQGETLPPSEIESEAKVELTSAATPELDSESNENLEQNEPVPEMETNEQPTDSVETSVASEIPDNQMYSAKDLFTQDQVNELTGKTRVETREKTFKYIYDRYGVSNEQEMDNLVGKAQRFDTLQDNFDKSKAEWAESDTAKNNEIESIKEQLALLQSGIDNDRYDDAKYILKGKGLPISLENIQSELSTHPEWIKSVESNNPEFSEPMPFKPVSKLSVLGNEPNNMGNVDSEEEKAMKLFKA